MVKYEKWLGAGLGWAVTGNPLGGLLGYIATSFITKGNKADAKKYSSGISEFEANLMVISSYLIKIDGKVSLEEIAFVKRFLSDHFDVQYDNERSQILHHCLQKEYNLNIVCDQLRLYTTHPTRIQVVHFLFDLAMSDGELHERENYFIFKIAGYLNIHDIDFRKIKKEHSELQFAPSDYEILGVKKEMSFVEIRVVYRKLVLKYHPDRNKDASEKERKKLAQKFQQIREAYEKIKRERG